MQVDLCLLLLLLLLLLRQPRKLSLKSVVQQVLHLETVRRRLLALRAARRT